MPKQSPCKQSLPFDVSPAKVPALLELRKFFQIWGDAGDVSGIMLQDYFSSVGKIALG